ncbi:imidazolonepropionase [Brevibacterium jeotgali]|uniref:Imidazolonepropionase n=1 Tax=Brevibacterium jeotgali TaxID=1262550 RepID=A0A2H1L3S9_9MICO|nr:imidazolonepropionase [Brevibacterium jeotgali]TWC01764.1 imidazolonepropionase [Brevibacterium jeotgali]SMY11509.1 imidazolonepropionase [Brevibacterium jeotgali]
MTTRITGIAELVTNDPAHAHHADPGGRLGVLHDAALIVDGGRVVFAGPVADAPSASSDDLTIDVAGRSVIPGFVDSHNHLVFAGDRTEEFAARMSGQSYSAGGIRTTMTATRAATDDELEENLVHLIDQARRQGTTTLEIKTGYGLTVEDELRALQIIARHSDESTLLAAHIVPPEYADDPDGYVDLIVDEVIPRATTAKWIDVFCDRGAFTPEQTERILAAGKTAGLTPRVHANQLQHGEGLQLAARTGCASADHATHATDEDLAALAAAGTVATLLPGAEFSTRAVYPDARRFLAAGVDLALATDCNPGSSFTNSMPFCLAVAVRDMHFTPAQALHAATAGGARALHRTDVGHLAPGARADFAILDAPSYVQLMYRPGVPLVQRVFLAGEDAH